MRTNSHGTGWHDVINTSSEVTRVPEGTAASLLDVDENFSYARTGFSVDVSSLFVRSQRVLETVYVVLFGLMSLRSC